MKGESLWRDMEESVFVVAVGNMLVSLTDILGRNRKRLYNRQGYAQPVDCYITKNAFFAPSTFPIPFNVQKDCELKRKLFIINEFFTFNYRSFFTNKISDAIDDDLSIFIID